MDLPTFLANREFQNHFPETVRPVFEAVLGTLFDAAATPFEADIQGNMMLGLRSEAVDGHCFDVRFVPFARTHAMVSPHSGKITIYFGKVFSDGRFQPLTRLAFAQETAPESPALQNLRDLATDPQAWAEAHPFDAIQEKLEFLRAKQQHNLPLNIMERKFLTDHS